MATGKALHYFLPFLLIAGCATHQTDLSVYYPSEGKQATVMIVKITEYDAQGRPVFSKILKERPAREGDQFTLVQFIDNRPERSFDIVIASERPDMTRPFRVIYEWTGKGFKAGVASGKNYIDVVLKEKQTSQTESNSLTGLESTTAVGPVLVLSVGGFIVGLAASVPATMQELSHVIVSAYESVISYSTYEYDSKQRLSRVKTYLPSDLSHEIIKTVYFYQDDETIPSKTEIVSFPENTVRTIP